MLATCAICHCNHSECDEVELVWPRVLKTWRDVSKSRFPEVFFSVVDRGEVYDFGDSVQSGRAGFAGELDPPRFRNPGNNRRNKRF